MNRCERLQESYVDYVYGELPPAQQEAMQRHLQECPACRQEVEALCKTVQLLRREPPLSIPQEVADRFEAGVYRRIAHDWMASEVQPLRLGWRQRLLALGRSAFGSWEWLRVPALMAASLALGVWVGASHFQPTPGSRPAMVEIDRSTPAERLAHHWQREVQWGLDEAQAARYLRNDPMAALEQYARLSELNAQDQELQAQLEAEKRELMRGMGI